MANYIISTCSATLTFPVYGKVTDRTSQLPVLREIVIRGGANVIDKHTLVTPKGVVTEVSDEDLAYLQNHDTFKELVTNGNLSVRKESNFTLDSTGHVDGMKGKDNSSQIEDAMHADGSDTRIFHASTTANAGKEGQYLGKQSAVMNSYGRIS